MKMTVGEIMSTNVIWACPNDSLYRAFQLLRQYEIRHLPVVNPNTKQVVGLLSEGDIILHCQSKGINLAEKSETLVEEAMTKKVIYCYPASRLTNVAATLISARINSIPVLDPQSHEILGIVTTTDFLDQICLSEQNENHPSIAHLNDGDDFPVKIRRSL